MIYLASYDITDNDIRLRLAKKLFKIGMERIQFSVFMGMLTPARHKELINWTTKLLKNRDDALFMLIPLDQYASQNTESAGTPPVDWEYLRGEKLVMFF